MSWLHYLLEANIYLGVFYLGYYVLLKNETHYLLNRVYLLLSCLLSFLVPFTQLGILRPAEPFVQQQVTALPALQHVNVVHMADATPVTQYTLNDGLIALYILGAAVTLVLLFYRLYRLFSLIRRHKALPASRYKVIELSGENTAFSFFNYLFIGSGLSQAETIVAHELVHIRQKHSVDIIFLELIKVIIWFNPLVYVIQRSLKTVHEYIADEQTAAREADCLAYSSFLLHNAYGLQGSVLAHSFFNYNLLKKRIIMLNQKRSGRLARLKYLAAVPLCAGMLCASTLVFSKDYGVIDLAPVKTTMLPATQERHSGITGAAPDIVKTDTPNMPPPPPPPVYIKKAYLHLQAYLYGNVKYPEEALKKKMNGSVILSYNIGSDRKIDNVSVIKSTWSGFDDVLVKAIKDYPFGIKENPGNKTIEISFMIPGVYLNYISDDKIRHDTGFAGNIIITNRPPDVKTVKFPPPALKPNGLIAPKKTNRKPPLPPPVIEKASPASAQINRRPPPPPPYDVVYKDLIMYVSKHIRYPAVAHNNKINGNVILSLNLNDKHQVSDVKIDKGIGYGCDEEAARALKSYTGVIDKAPGNYKLVVTYTLTNNDDTKFYGPKPLSEKVINTSNFIGEIIITGYVK